MNPVVIRGPALLFLLAMAPLAPALGQQLLQPAVPVSGPPVVGAGSRLTQSQPVAPATVTAAPGARPLQSPIRAQGPANEQASPAIRKAATAPKAAGITLVNAAGVPLTGYIQVAPNRVYDPASGQYHWTVRSGDQQKIVK